MKLPRRRYWVPFALLLAFLAIARFDLHYHFIGWWRGDAYYQGMPTSYWRDAAVHYVHGPPKWLDILYRVTRFRPSGDGSGYAIFKSDPKNAAVLAQLLGNPSLEADVRERLIWERVGRGTVSKEMAAAVRHTFQTGDDRIKFHAAYFLVDSERDSDSALQYLFEVWRTWANDPQSWKRCQAARHMSDLVYWHRQFDRRPFLAILRPLEQDRDRDVREAATVAVKNLSEWD